MKNPRFFLLATVLLFGICFVSCKKDPTFSDKITGAWSSDKVTYDNGDETALFSYNLILQANKVFDLTQTTPLATGNIVSRGTWETNDQRESIIMHYDDNTTPGSYDITNLTESQMTAQTILNGKRLIIEFKKS